MVYRYSLILLIISFNLLGSAQYFNKRYDYGNNSAETAMSILEISNGYLVAGTSRDSINRLSIGLIKLDYEGEVLWKKIHPPPLDHSFYIGYFGGTIKLEDNSYINVGGIEDTTGNYNIYIYIYIYKFDENGDSLWFSEIDLGSDFESGYQCIEDNGNIILVGEHKQSAFDNDMLLVKADSNGNYLWHNTYDGSQYERGGTIDKCFDGGYILGGYSSDNVAAGNSSYDTYVVKTDSLGNLEWEEFYGDSIFDGFAHVKQLSDSNFIVATTLGKYEIFDETQKVSRLIKIDSIGEIIWDKEYGDILREAALAPVHELIDGSIITAGTIFDSPNDRPEGIVFKVDADGELIWYRKHEYFTNANAENYLRDMKPTSDGGMIACGFIYPSASDTGTQDYWVIKLDDLGYVSGIFEPTEDNLLTAKVFPNPTTDYFNIEFKQPQPGVMSLYNTLGMEVKRVELKRELTTTVSIYDLPVGTYFLNLTNDNELLFSGKVVVTK